MKWCLVSGLTKHFTVEPRDGILPAPPLVSKNDCRPSLSSLKNNLHLSPLLPLPLHCLISKSLHCSAQLKRIHIFLKGWLNLIIRLTSSLPSKWSSSELEGFVLKGESVTGTGDREKGEQLYFHCFPSNKLTERLLSYNTYTCQWRPHLTNFSHLILLKVFIDVCLTKKLYQNLYSVEQTKHLLYFLPCMAEWELEIYTIYTMLNS